MIGGECMYVQRVRVSEREKTEKKRAMIRCEMSRSSDGKLKRIIFFVLFFASEIYTLLLHKIYRILST